MFKDAVSLQGKHCPLVMSILLLLALLTTNGPATAQDACPPPIPMPTVDSNSEEVIHLWEDILVQEAQAVLCLPAPGGGQVLGIIDWEFGDLTEEGIKHGSYTSQIAAGGPDGTGHGYTGGFPGIAAGAVMVEEGVLSRWDGSARTIDDAMRDAFRDAADQTGPEAAIGFSMTLEPASWLTGQQVRSMLDDFRSYTEHGIVVLPANFFDRDLAARRSTRSRVTSSRVLVVHQILRERMQYDENCEIPDTQCATLPYAIDLVVPTTNGNNSIVVPAVLGTIALMKNANPSLTNVEIMAILTNPANFSAAVTVGGRAVPVLNALEAVNAACSFVRTEIVVQILYGTDDAGPDPGLDCGNFTDRNEVYFAKCLDNQTDITSGFRFVNVPIPRRARILDARIEFTVDGPYDNEVQLEIIGEQKTRARTFGPGRWPSQRTDLTDASVAWTIPSSDVWKMAETRRTPNLSAILQEIVDLRGWNPANNAVAILVRNAGPAEIGPQGEYHRRVFALERDPGEAARLVVSFVDRANSP